jgi:hypothetical protein
LSAPKAGSHGESAIHHSFSGCEVVADDGSHRFPRGRLARTRYAFGSRTPRFILSSGSSAAAKSQRPGVRASRQSATTSAARAPRTARGAPRFRARSGRASLPLSTSRCRGRRTQSSPDADANRVDRRGALDRPTRSGLLPDHSPRNPRSRKPVVWAGPRPGNCPRCRASRDFRSIWRRPADGRWVLR